MTEHLSAPALPTGQRVYAIGDVHGCLAQLKQLIAKIDEECARDGVAARKIFLGDLVDRGLQSRQTIDYCLDLQKNEKEAPVFLLGNHEKVMRGLLSARDEEIFADWLCFGGRETLLSYDVPLAVISAGAGPALEALTSNIPPAHVRFLDRLAVSASFGDYFFCHAGVRPGRDLSQQKEEDLIWIRHEFLASALPFGKIVVHGHSISSEAEFRQNRIGIDTGAYATGRLTALGLEGTRQWLVQTR